MRFDLDTQRTVICLAGLGGLFFQLLVYPLFQVSPNQGLTGAFLTMALGPIGFSAIEKFSSRRQGPDDPDPPSTYRPPDPRQPRESRDEIEFMVAA